MTAATSSSLRPRARDANKRRARYRGEIHISAPRLGVLYFVRRRADHRTLLLLQLLRGGVHGGGRDRDSVRPVPERRAAAGRRGSVVLKREQQ
jgi:hypothetical protein